MTNVRLLIALLLSEGCSKLIAVEVTRWAELGDRKRRAAALASAGAAHAANISAKSGVEATFAGASRYEGLLCEHCEMHSQCGGPHGSRRA
jgi:hypothetical protein